MMPSNTVYKVVPGKASICDQVKDSSFSKHQLQKEKADQKLYESVNVRRI